MDAIKRNIAMHRMKLNRGFEVALVLAAGAGSTMAADDCRLGIVSDTPIVAFGETVSFGVDAYFPATGYAFASTAFDVLATNPGWTAASGGIVAGGSVLGISASQPHLPGTGIIADPANPFHVWDGTWTPQTPGPKLVKFETAPGAFTYYSNILTPSSLPCDATAWRSYVWVDPMVVGNYGRVAAAEGTVLEQTGPSDFVVSPDDTQAILIGLLLPAVQGAREASRSTLVWSGEPGLFRYGLLANPESDPEADVVPTDQLSLNFTKIEFDRTNDGEAFELAIETPVQYGAIDWSICRWSRPGEPDYCYLTSDEPVQIGELPTSIEARLIKRSANEGDQIVFVLGADQDRYVRLPGVYEGYTREPIVVRIMPIYIEIDGLAGDVIEAAGMVGSLAISFSPPCRTDVNGDGSLDFFDVQSYLRLFSAGEQGADFNDDGRLNFFDVQSFLHSFSEGCP